MITEEKITIFKRHDGDIDSWTRCASKKEKSIMSDKDWCIIDALIQDIFIVEKGLASSVFRDNLSLKLKETCDNISTINQLKGLAHI